MVVSGCVKLVDLGRCRCNQPAIAIIARIEGISCIRLKLKIMKNEQLEIHLKIELDIIPGERRG